MSIDDDQRVPLAKRPPPTSSFSWAASLPSWVWLVLAVAVVYWTHRAWRALRLRGKVGKYKIEKRRRAGIPDSDKRPFKEALLAVIAKRKEEEAAQEAENKAQEVKGAQDWAAWGEKTGMRRRELTPNPMNGLSKASQPPSSPLGILHPYQRRSSSASPVPSSDGGDASDGEEDFNDRSRQATPRAAYEYGSGSILSSKPTPGRFRRAPSPPSTRKPQLRKSSGASRKTSSSSRKVSQPGSIVRPPTGPRRASGQKTVVQQSKKRAFEEESDGELDVEMDGGEASFESSEDEAAASDRKRRRKAAAVEEENEGMDFEEVETGSATEDEMTIDDSPPRRATGSVLSPVSISPEPEEDISSKSKTKRPPSSIASISRAPKRRKSIFDSAGSAEDAQGRQEGEEWNDPNGLRFRIGKDGRGRERLVLVRKMLRKFDMPVDSQHPDRDVMIMSAIPQWVNEAEFKALKTQKALSWQDDEDDEASSKKEGKPTDTESESGFDRATPPATSRHKGLYHITSRSTTPLRPSSSLASSLNGGSPARLSPSGGRLRMASLSHSRLGNSTGMQRAVGEEEKRRREETMLKRLRSEVEKGKAASASASVSKPPATSTCGASVAVPALASSTTTTAAESAKPVAATNPFSFGAAPAAASTTTTTSATKAPEPSKPAASNPFAALGGSSTPTSIPAASTLSDKPTEASKPAGLNSFSLGAPAALMPAAPAGLATPTLASNPFAKKDEPAKAPAPSLAPSFSFGAPSAAPATSSKEEPAKTTAVAASTPSFNFGAPAKPTEPAKAPDVPSSTSSFGFGAPAKNTSAAAPVKPASSAPSFSFGASAPSASSPAAAAPPVSGSPAPFSFGGPTASQPSASPAPFSFGSAAGPTVAAPKESSPAPPSFSFGSASSSASAPSKPALPSTPSFSFGATPVAPAAASPPSSNPFSFGASSAAPFTSSGTSTPTAGAPPSTTPSFSFGVSSSAPKPASPAPFSFGASSSSSAPAAAAAAAPKPSFSFGAASNTAPVGAGASAPSFSFNTSSSTPSTAPTAGGFNFGAPGAGAAPSASGSTTSSFSFGAPAGGAPGAAGTPPTAPGSGFAFGSGGSTTPGGGGMFTFGKK